MPKFKEITKEEFQQIMRIVEGKSTYKMERYNRFWDEVRSLGREPYHYQGRNHFRGPAANVSSYDEIQDIVRKTSMPLQWDNMGLGWVVYPK
jgi:hypothetical protein